MGNIRVKLKPQQGIKVGNTKKYLFDPDLIIEAENDARDWATKTDGLVNEEDYSSKAYAIGGTGTETNNSKYWAEQSATSASNASTSETNAGLSATSASNSASTATTQAGIATTQAGIATTKAGEASSSASTATTQAGIATSKANDASTSATNAGVSETNASNSATSAGNSATIATTQAGLSKQYAIGDPTEPAEGSAKYWAEQASHSVPNDGQLDIQVNGTSVATFTANQATNTTANIVVGSGLPSQTGNAGKVLGTDGTDASWQYSIKDKGSYSSSTQYYPGDVVQYYYDGVYSYYLCRQATQNNNPLQADYWLPFKDNKITVKQLTNDFPLLAWNRVSWSGGTINTISLNLPQNTTGFANQPTVNTYSGLLKVPGGIDGYYTSAQVDALIPTVNDSTITFTQGGVTKGSFTLNQSSGTTISLDAGGTADQTYDGTSTNAQSGIAIAGELANYTPTSSLASVATSGDYDDLINKPSITIQKVNSLPANPSSSILYCIPES